MGHQRVVDPSDSSPSILARPQINSAVAVACTPWLKINLECGAKEVSLLDRGTSWRKSTKVSVCS